MKAAVHDRYGPPEVPAGPGGIFLVTDGYVNFPQGNVVLTASG